MAQTAIISPQILDSTQIGRDLITAADQAAVQAIVGAEGVDLTADYTWTGDHKFTSLVQVEAAAFDQNISGVSGDADRAYIGTTAYSDPATKQTNATTHLKFEGDYVGAEWSTWRIGLEEAYEMYFGVSAFAVRYNGSFRFGLVDFGDGAGAGLAAQNATLGLSGYRWPISWLEEVYVSDNMNLEVGSALKVYNLGDAGDDDTEFVSMAWLGNDFEITAGKTGVGTVQDIDISANQVALKYNSGTGVSTRLSCDSNSVKVWRNFHNGADGVYNCGIPTSRWLGMYSVNANFSGTVTTDTVNASGTVTANAFVGDGSGLTNLPAPIVSNPFDQELNTTDSVTFDEVTMSKQITNLFGVEGDADRSYFETNYYDAGTTDVATFYWNNTGNKVVAGSAFKIGYAQGWNMHFQDDAFVFQQQGGFRMGIYQDAFVSSYMPLGSDVFHWSAGWFDDVKVFDNLINEDGSDRLHYGLGEAGDADTEYVREFWDGNTYKTKNYKTGNGALRSMSIESSDGTGVLVTPYDIRLRRAGVDRILIDSTTIRPTTNNFMENGTLSKRWKGTYSYISSTATKILGEVGCVFKQFAEGDDTSTDSSYYQTTFVAGNMYIGTKTAGDSTAADLYFQRDSVTKLALLDEGVRLYNVLTVPSTTSGVIYKDANGFLKLS